MMQRTQPRLHVRLRAQGEPETVSCRTYTNFEELEPLADEWDALAGRAGGDIYGTFDWCRTWWEFYGQRRRLEVHLVWRGAHLVAILPLFRETLRLGGLPVRCLRLLGCDHSIATCDVLLEQGLEEEAIQALARSVEVNGRADWDLLSLGPLPGYAPRTETIARVLRKYLCSCQVECRDCGCHTVFNLPETYDEYLGRLSRREQANIRQDERRLRREHQVKHVVSLRSEEVGPAFTRFVSKHQVLWRREGKLGHFDDWPAAREFHSRLVELLAAKGRVYVAELLADGQVVAAQYGFRFGRHLHWFLTAREDGAEWRNVSLGRVGLMRLIQYAIDDGAALIDGLGGYYEYKLKAGGRLTRKQSITVVRSSLSSAARLRALRVGAKVLDTLYYRLWFARLGPRLGLLRGPIWRSWITSRPL